MMLPSMAEQIAAAQAANSGTKNKGTLAIVAKAAELRQRILETVEDNGEIEAKAIASILRANVGTVSHHLMALAEARRVEFTDTWPRKWRLR